MLAAKVGKTAVTKACALNALKTIEVEIDVQVQCEHEKNGGIAFDVTK